MFILDSLVEIEKVAEHINALVAEYEDAQKIIELQSRISNPISLVKPGRKLIRQGPLMRVSRKRNASYLRHFILLSDILLYCKGNAHIKNDEKTIFCPKKNLFQFSADQTYFFHVMKC